MSKIIQKKWTTVTSNIITMAIPYLSLYDNASEMLQKSNDCSFKYCRYTPSCIVAFLSSSLKYFIAYFSSRQTTCCHVHSNYIETDIYLFPKNLVKIF